MLHYMGEWSRGGGSHVIKFTGTLIPVNLVRAMILSLSLSPALSLCIAIMRIITAVTEIMS